MQRMHEGTPRVLVIEDNPRIRLMVRHLLTANHFAVFEADTGSRGLQEFAACEPEVVLLDVELPDLDGFQVLRQIRSHSAVPVIIFSARSDPQTKNVALSTGATDYLAKPFAPADLLLRLDAAVKNVPGIAVDAQGHFTAGDLEVELNSGRVHRNGHDVQLTPIEFELFAMLICHAGSVLTYDFLVARACDAGHSIDRDLLRTTIATLRHKIETDPIRPKLFFSELGVGYRLLVPSHARP
jgi:two-component system KDP operon response regulator KdpE